MKNDSSHSLTEEKLKYIIDEIIRRKSEKECVVIKEISEDVGIEEKAIRFLYFRHFLSKENV